MIVDDLDKPESSYDEVLREVHRIKEELARQHDFDVRRIVEDAQKKQAQSGRKIVPAPIRQKT
jgi:hypothetical protein